MKSVVFENLPVDASILDKFNEIKGLAAIIKAESTAMAGHTDPQAYNECWTWLLEAMDEFSIELISASKK